MLRCQLWSMPKTGGVLCGGEPLQTAIEFATITSNGEGGCEVLFLIFMNSRHMALSGVSVCVARRCTE